MIKVTQLLGRISLSGLYLKNRAGSSYLVGTLVRGCRCAMSWCDLDLTLPQ